MRWTADLGRRTGVRILWGGFLACWGCGPTTALTDSVTGQTPGGESTGAEAEDEGSSGPGPGMSTSTGTSTGSVPSEGSSDSTTAEVHVCGDGQLDDAEACDDGNVSDADGCSQLCEISGTPTWAHSVDLASARFEVLDVRDGDAYVFASSSSPPGGLLTRVGRDGTVVFGAEVPPSGSGAMQVCMTASPDGGVVSSGSPGEPQPSQVRRLGPDGELIWEETLDGWGQCRNIRWMNQGLLSLHRPHQVTPASLRHTTAAGNSQVVAGFPNLGPTLSLHPAGLVVGGDEQVTVLVWDPEANDVALHTGVDILTVPKWTSTTWPAQGQTAPRAFSHGDEIVVWTETERTRIDPQGIPSAPEPRTTQGFVVGSFPNGVVIRNGESVEVYTDDGELRWSRATDGAALEAMPDDAGGLFVVSATESPVSEVTLQHFVL